MTSAGAYRWEDLPREVARPGVQRCAVAVGDAMVVFNTCEPGMEVRPHSHAFAQIALITAGEAVFHVGTKRHEVRSGSVVIVPAGVVHSLEPTGRDPVENIDIFAPPRDDYRHLVAWMAVNCSSTNNPEHRRGT
jgi:quercetin dioxygenase-like cupin family protein